MLTVASQMLRAKEREDIEQIGLPFYNPMDNNEINDKKNLDNNDGLAEKIVKQDSDAIYNSDIIVIEPQPFALGTHVELGQIKGRKDLAEEVLRIYNDESLDDLEALEEIRQIALKAKNQKVFPHYEDIRRFKGVVEKEDRRSLGINQYVYGVCLDLTDGKGFYEWDEILDELQEIKDSNN
jgi:hypothetical protein